MSGCLWVCRQQEGKASADSLADLKASAARELAEVRKQAKEQLQQSGSEAQVKLAAVQSAREALQGQVEKLQDSNGVLHQQLADAHGKVCTCCSAVNNPVVFLVEGLPICLSACLPACVPACLTCWSVSLSFNIFVSMHLSVCGHNGHPAMQCPWQWLICFCPVHHCWQLSHV